MVYADRVYGERVRRFSHRIETVLYDAYRRMDAEREAAELGPPRPELVNVFSWPQEWPDWSCGFGGEAREEPCVDQTHVVTDDERGVAYVYHAARFVRRLEKPGKAFWVAVRKHGLPAATDEAEWSKLEARD
ncbi:MAG TPA: hypothetical protein VMM12_00105 [Longimicrobiales bacterium]|nr:hypothetical protein [Longimicrobiales bacterium]